MNQYQFCIKLAMLPAKLSKYSKFHNNSVVHVAYVLKIITEGTRPKCFTYHHTLCLHLKHKINLNHTYKFSSNVTENTPH